jgi:outer membrane protein TolC
MVLDPCKAAVALLLATPAFLACATPLSLDHALRLAEQRSRELAAQDAAAAASRHRAVAAGQRPDPVLKAGISNLPVNGADRFSLGSDFMTMRSVGLMQEWTRSDKLQARAARFEREAEAAEAGRRLALANLRRDTAIAWLDRHFQERMRELLLAQREQALLQVQGAEAAYRGGRGAQADVFGARSALALIDDRLAATERDVASAKTMLARWVGAVPDDTLDTPPGMQEAPWRDEDLDARIERHPQIAVMLRQEAMAQADADAARADKRPDVSVELMYSQRGSAYSNMVSVNLSMPLQWDPKHRQDRELASRLATVDQVRAQREEEARWRAAEARSWLVQWRGNRQRLLRYEQALMPLAAARTQAALAAYRGGTGPLSAVLDGRRAEVDTRMERLRLEMETARLWAQLNYLIP